MTRDGLQRAFAFERAMHGAVGRTITGAWGQAFLSPELDRCYDRNLLWAVDDAGGLSAAQLDGHAERLLGGHDMAHRRLLLEPPVEERLHDRLVGLGYDASRHVFQLHPGRAATPAAVEGVEVVEAGIEDVLAANDRYLQTDRDTPYGRDARTRRHLLEHHRSYGPGGAQERRFAVRDGDDVVAWARLWKRGDEAQVEDVVCLAEHRGRGYGRAVVAAATRAALADDPELLFIVADASDWPQELYARLGYATAGELGVYLRFARMPQASGPGAA
ncbi:MAG: family N-acetyltransferase [Conexibacter sp.]|nr:family N-acetyltransferase [Conexibacter sp.]